MYVLNFICCKIEPLKEEHFHSNMVQQSFTAKPLELWLKTIKTWKIEVKKQTMNAILKVQ